MANVEHINRVIASIRGEQAEIKALGVGFNMSNYLGDIDPGRRLDNVDHGPNNCGTIACIAGHAYIQACLARNETPDMDADSADIETEAAEYLGITKDQGDDLFIPALSLFDVTVDQAVKVLVALGEKNVVDWRKRCDDIDTDYEDSTDGE